jgi:hypothetical protein
VDSRDAEEIEMNREPPSSMQRWGFLLAVLEGFGVCTRFGTGKARKDTEFAFLSFLMGDRKIDNRMSL